MIRNTLFRHLIMGIVSYFTFTFSYANQIGISTPGSTDYPNGGMAPILPFTGFQHEDGARCAITNTSGTMAWIGLNTSQNFPGAIVAMNLATMTKVGKLELQVGERGIIGAAADPSLTYGYFLVSNTPARIVKVHLPTLTRVASLDLEAGEAGGSIVADQTGTYAYVGLMTIPGEIVRINLANFTRSSSLTLPAGENLLAIAKVDPAGVNAYFLSQSLTAGSIVKIQLSDFTRVSAILLSDGNPFPGDPTDMAFDPVNPNRIYITVRKIMNGAKGRVFRVSFDPFSIQITEHADPFISSINVTQDGSRALIGYGHGAFRFVELNIFQILQTTYPPLGGATSLSKVLSLGHTPETLLVLYQTAPGVLEKATFTNNVVTRGIPQALDGGEETFTSMAQDPDGRFFYAGTAFTKFVKIDLARRRRVAGVQLDLKQATQDSIAASGRNAYSGSRQGSGNTAYRVDTKSMQVAATQTDYGEGTLAELVFSPWNGGIYPIFNPFNAESGSLGFADPLSLGYSGLFAYPAPVSLRSLVPSLTDNRLYYIDEHSALVTSWKDANYTYSSPLLGGPKKILRAGNGPFYTVTASRLFELDPLSLGINQNLDLRSMSGITELTLDGGAIASNGQFNLYHGAASDLPAAQRLLVRHNLTGSPQFGFLNFSSFIQNVLIDKDNTKAYVQTSSEITRVGLTRRERIEGTRFSLNEAAVLNTANFYSHASVGPRRLESLADYDHTDLISGFMDRVHQRAWFATGQSPAHVVSFDPNTREIVNTLTLDSGEDQAQCAACDPTGAFGYFGTFTSPGRVVKVNLANGTRSDAVPLQSGENNLRAIAIDPAGSFAYFADSTSPANIIKVRIAPTFSRVGVLPLQSGEESARELAIDPLGQFLYVACATNPGKIVKIQLSDFTRLGVLNLNPGENSPQALAIYPDGAFMYAACAAFPSIVVKIRLSDFTRADARTLDPGEDNAAGLTLSNVSKNLLVACDTVPPVVARINLTNFQREGAGSLRSDTEVNLKTIFFDNAGQFAFLGTNTNPGRIVTFEAAPRPLRLGVYSEYNNTYQRLWQSPPLPVNTADAWSSVPISQGTPNSLYLSGGNYLLAWQFDADESGPSFTPGNQGDGVQVPYLYGPFPDTLSAAAGTNWTPTSSRWSMYLDYTSKNTAHDWEALH